MRAFSFFAPPPPGDFAAFDGDLGKVPPNMLARLVMLLLAPLAPVWPFDCKAYRQHGGHVSMSACQEPKELVLNTEVGLGCHY